jgi:osmotically-inducible protein OsmY
MSHLFFLFAALFLTMSGCRMVDTQSDPAISAHLRTVNQNAATPLNQKPVSPTAKSYRYDNQKLSHEVLAALLSQDALKSAHIQVAGYHGDLLILGEVPNESSVQLAQNIASSFQDVKNLQTDLTVGKNLNIRQRAADSASNTQVKTEIANLGIPHSHLQILTNNNKVYIIGPVSNSDQLVIEQNLLALTNVDNVYFYYQ